MPPPPQHKGTARRKPGHHRARLRFERLPGVYCHPERIASLLPEGLPIGFRDRLIGSKRLRVRLSALLARRFRLAPCCAGDLDTPEGRLAQLEGEPLQNAIQQAGAIWHAKTIRKIILSEQLRRLIELLGRDNHRAALRFIDLAADDDGTRGPFGGDDQPPLDVEKLLGRIERDGLVAVNAWCRHQPASIAGRLKLKLPPCPEADGDLSADHEELGLRIVDRVVMTLAEAPPNAVHGHG
ncbi:MAG: SctK family type III secretion system sorting platform protein [Pseudomonadota bacterium]